MNYNETVDRVMALLKEKEVCLSSQKSHRDCYESLGYYMKQRNEHYSDAILKSWLADIKNELSSQRYTVWVQYTYQLEEMDSTGTISDRRLYLNRSHYEKLPTLWKKDLDVYLDDCSIRYTSRTLESARIYFSEGLLFLDDMGVHGNKHAKDGEYNFQIIETKRAFEYDEDGKLTKAVEDEERQGQYIYLFEYDDIGNRTYYEKSRNGTVQESARCTYNAQTNWYRPRSATERRPRP